MKEFTTEKIQSFDDLISLLKNQPIPYDMQLIEKAYLFAKRIHGETLRKSGFSQIDHCVQVAALCTRMQFDTVTITCALLHDVVEKGEVSIDEVDKEFGTEIAFIIDGLSHVRSVSKNYSFSDADKQEFNKLLFKSSEDLRVIVIRLAEKIDNLLTVDGVDLEIVQSSARKALNIYAPIAEYMGLSSVKKVLEDEAFKILQPEDYKVVFENMSRLSDNFQILLTHFEATVESLMKEYSIDNYEFYGRKKGIYSAYRKIKTKYLEPGAAISNYTFEDLKDVYAFRLIVDTVERCYLTLGLLHSRFEYSKDDFRDYISRPKENGYKSIHTVLQFEQNTVEVQIRTREMHEYNEYGPASHIAYKLSQQGKDTKSQTWTQDLLRSSEKAVLTKEDFKLHAFEESIFVFTPKGLVIRLPKNATPIDFAFRVHTHIGLHYQGALVNGKMVKMNYELKTGDVIEVITTKKINVSSDWLKFSKSTAVRGHIRKFLNGVKSL